MKKEVMLSLISIFLFLLVLPFVLGVEGLCVTAEVSDISPSSIKIGDEFTIGIQIENCGTSIPKNVTFEILSLPEHLSVKEPWVNIIPKIQYSNSERFLVFHMKVDDEAESGTYVIKTRLSYDSGTIKITKDDEILIDVIGDKAELSIASLKTDPVLPKKGEVVELTLRIENTGDGTAKSVSVYVDHPFQGLKQSFLGALDSDEDGPAVLTFIVDKSGGFEFPITINYKDDFGDNEIQTEINLTILKKKTNWIVIIVSVIVVALIILGIFYYFKLKKSKNKIIHQLLGGESKEETEQSKTPKINLETHSEKKEREKKERIRKEFKREVLKKYRK